MSIDVEHIVVKIYSEFYINTVRVESLKSFCDNFENIEYSRLLGYAKTRFLALGPAIGSILKMYEPLKEHFLKNKRCPVAINAFFKPPRSKLYLMFIKEQVNISNNKLYCFKSKYCELDNWFSFIFLHIGRILPAHHLTN